MFYTTFPENRHRSQLHTFHLRENTALCPDNVHIFHCSYDRRILRHILFNTNWWRSWNVGFKNSVTIASTCFNKDFLLSLINLEKKIKKTKSVIYVLVMWAYLVHCDLTYKYSNIVWRHLFIQICTKCFFQ